MASKAARVASWLNTKQLYKDLSKKELKEYIFSLRKMTIFEKYENIGKVVHGMEQ